MQYAAVLLFKAIKNGATGEKFDDLELKIMTKISHFNAQIQIINQLSKDQALIEVIDACRELMKGFPKSKLLYDLRIFEFDKLERYNDAE